MSFDISHLSFLFFIQFHLNRLKWALNGAEAAALAIVIVAIIRFFAKGIGLISLVNYAFGADPRANAASRAFIIDKFRPVGAPETGFIGKSCAWLNGDFHNSCS